MAELVIRITEGQRQEIIRLLTEVHHIPPDAPVIHYIMHLEDEDY